jgi:hypothetical protein
VLALDSAIYQGVARLHLLYAQLLDEGRYSEWSELFAADGEFSFWGSTYEGRATIRQTMETVSASQPGAGKHIVAQPVVEQRDSGVLAWADFVGLHISDDGAVNTVATGRYYDSIVNVDDHYLFQRRQVRFALEPLPAGATPTPQR